MPPSKDTDLAKQARFAVACLQLKENIMGADTPEKRELLYQAIARSAEQSGSEVQEALESRNNIIEAQCSQLKNSLEIIEGLSSQLSTYKFIAMVLWLWLLAGW